MSTGEFNGFSGRKLYGRKKNPAEGHQIVSKHLFLL
jgi:hypothetical protein